MSKRVLTLFTIVLLTLVAVTACAQPTPTPAPTPVPVAKAAIRITGMVQSEKAWSIDELKAMKQTDAQTKNIEGSMDTYTGVTIADLLSEAGVRDGASTLVLLADDGCSAEVPIDDVKVNGCILAFRTKGGLRSAMPNLPGNTNVKGVVEIQVK